MQELGYAPELLLRVCERCKDSIVLNRCGATTNPHSTASLRRTHSGILWPCGRSIVTFKKYSANYYKKSATIFITRYLSLPQSYHCLPVLTPTYPSLPLLYPITPCRPVGPTLRRLFQKRLRQAGVGTEMNRLDGRERTRDQSAEVCLLLWEERTLSLSRANHTCRAVARAGAQACTSGYSWARLTAVGSVRLQQLRAAASTIRIHPTATLLRWCATALVFAAPLSSS